MLDAMTRPRSRPWLVAVAVTVVLAVALAACDGGGSGKEARKPRRSTTTTTSSAAPTSTTSTTLPSDPSANATTTVPVPAGTCGAQEPAIVAAVQGQDPSYKTGYQAPRCKLGTANPTWALVRLVPSAGSGSPARTIALERVGALWTVRATGNDPNVCDGIPPAVATDLLGPGCP
jgi:hypothetical protein